MTKAVSPLLYVKIFLIIVFVAAVISVIYKSSMLVSQGSFKGSSFNMLYQGKQNYLIHIDSIGKKLLVVKLSKENDISAKNRIGKSLSLAVLIDGVILLPASDTYDKPETLFDFSALLNLLFDKKIKYDNINDFDLIKMVFVVNSIPRSEKRQATGIESIRETDLADKKVLDERLSVAVINASEVDGLGSKMAQVLKSAGYNVVSIDSSESKKSQINASTLKNASVARLGNFLNVPSKKTIQQTTDVTVVVGKDLLK